MEIAINNWRANSDVTFDRIVVETSFPDWSASCGWRGELVEVIETELSHPTLRAFFECLAQLGLAVIVSDSEEPVYKRDWAVVHYQITEEQLQKQWMLFQATRSVSLPSIVRERQRIERLHETPAFKDYLLARLQDDNLERARTISHMQAIKAVEGPWYWTGEHMFRVEPDDFDVEGRHELVREACWCQPQEFESLDLPYWDEVKPVIDWETAERNGLVKYVPPQQMVDVAGPVVKVCVKPEVYKLQHVPETVLTPVYSLMINPVQRESLAASA